MHISCILSKTIIGIVTINIASSIPTCCICLKDIISHNQFRVNNIHLLSATQITSYILPVESEIGKDKTASSGP